MRNRWLLSVSLAAIVVPGAAIAASAPLRMEIPAETVLISAAKVRSLEQFTPTGSRLGLTARETPATLDQLTFEEMIGRGFHTVEEASSTLPGVLAANPPGDMGNFSMRGFTGNQITLLHNGLNLGPATMIARPGNTFNLASLEVLKGPASVLYGQGAIGGAINAVNKGASFGPSEFTMIAAAGSFGTTNLGIGGGTAITDKLAIRADLSRTSTNGYVRKASAESVNATVSFLWRPIEKLDVQLTVDYLKDNPSNYFGTPLVTGSAASVVLDVVKAQSGLVIDKAMRYVNYNVADSEVKSEQWWPQLLLKWEASPNLTFRNFSYFFTAERRWKNSETYQFNSSTNLIDRDRFFVFHDQKTWGNQTNMTYRSDVFGMMANTVVVGVDYSGQDFKTQRGFPGGDSVDRLNPSPGVFGPIVARNLATKWQSFGVFAEDALDITRDLKLVTGVRAETIDLERQNYNFAGAFVPSTSFNRTFHATTWRAGLVYNVTDDITPYFSYSTGKDPSGTSNFYLVNAGQNFDLSTSRQFELGVKATTPDKMADLTIAVYDINRDNILTQINLAGTLSNIGSQRSRGVEVAGDIRITDNWTVSGNVAFTDAWYASFVDPDSGINATGLTPANVAKWVGNLWTSVRNVGGLPLELGGGLRYVGPRFGNISNDLKLNTYTLVDVYGSYELRPGMLLIGRVRNLFDQPFVLWADIFYPSEVLLGAPRTFELSLVARF
jgi:iron complex outermembrane receptor protein